MSSKQTSGNESIATRKQQLIASADAGSLERAQEDVYEFVLAGDSHVNVKNTSYDESGHTYTVAVEGGLPVRCTCPAFEHHDGPCKHVLAVAIRSPIMTALSGVSGSSKPVAPDGGVEFPPITTHYEPAAQGGEKYVRCEGCGREILSELGGRSKLVHPEGCPHADD